MSLETGLVVGAELPFRRSVGEPERAFACFWVYLELGEDRMWLDVAEKTGVSFYTIKCWAWRYKWNKRIEVYYEWAEENRRTEDGGQRTEDGLIGVEDRGPKTEDRETGDSGRAAGSGNGKEVPGQREERCHLSERLAGERLRRAAERALERFGCEQQARKVGLGEIARTLVAAFRMGRPEPEKGKGAEKPWLTPEEEAAIDREFMAAADRIVAIEEAEERKQIEDREPKAEDGGSEDGLKEVGGQKPEVGGQGRGAIGQGATCPPAPDTEPRAMHDGVMAQGDNAVPPPDAPGVALAGMVLPPLSGRKKKPPQYSAALREWVTKKYGDMVSTQSAATQVRKPKRMW